jgi:hypothetical protein
MLLGSGAERLIGWRRRETAIGVDQRLVGENHLRTVGKPAMHPIICLSKGAAACVFCSVSSVSSA